ncbi:MAG: hypothetical protein ACKO4A_07420, partial [Gammaproteobacteria bacterium]
EMHSTPEVPDRTYDYRVKQETTTRKGSHVGGRLVHEGEHAVDRTQARRYAFSGARRPEAGWPEGVYTGEITIERSVEGKPQRSSTLVEARVGG